MQSIDTTRIDARYRIFLVMWFGFLVMIAVYAALAFLVLNPKNARPDNPVLTWTYFGIGTLSAISSFVVKRTLYRQAVEKQDFFIVMRGFIIASALCEVAGILALLLFLTTPSGTYKYLFIVAAVSMLAHFPRRADLMAASYKIKKSNDDNHY